MKKSLGKKTILYPTPVWIIGSFDKNGKPNAMAASWSGICCSNPPAVAVAIRKPRYTYENIMAKKAFTVNIPSEKYVKEADYFGIISGRDADKFLATGLTAVKSTLVDAPYIKEFPMAIECKLLDTLEIGIHTLFIGEIMDVKCDEDLLGENNMPNMEKLKTFAFDPGTRKYYKTGAYLAQGFSVGKEIKK